MTNPQAPFQTEQSATQHTEALVRAEGMLGTVELHGGSLITIDHEGVAALAAKTRHVEIPVTAVVGVVLTRPTIMANGRLDLVVRTTDGDSRYDPKAPNPFSVSFLAKDLDGFRNVAQSIEAAKPAEPAAIEPPKPEKRRPFWRRGAFWSMAALAVVFCCLMNLCGSVSDDSATESMPDVVGMDYAHVHQALADYHDVDYRPEGQSHAFRHGDETEPKGGREGVALHRDHRHSRPARQDERAEGAGTIETGGRLQG